MFYENVDYSVDMIRIRNIVNCNLFNIFMQKILDNLNYEVKYFETFELSKYRHNFTIKINDTSVYIGTQHNSKKNEKNKLDVVLEYNPNKINEFESDILSKILQLFFNVSDKHLEIVRCDVACDLHNVNIKNLIFDTNKTRNYKIFKGATSDDDYTYYIGKENPLKIYNKSNELGYKKAGIDYDFTRYEYTLKINEYIDRIHTLKLKVDYCPIYIFTDEYESNNLKINDTDRVILYALSNGYDFNLLSRRKKDIVELYKIKTFYLTNEKIIELLKNYVLKLKKIQGVI